MRILQNEPNQGNKINVINDTGSYYKKQHHELINDACFNNVLWRSILNKIISEIDIHNEGLQIISPFGFEVMQDKRFLRAKLRRFYCYIGIPIKSGMSKIEIYRKFENKLFNVLSRDYPDFFNLIVIKVIDDKFIKLKHYDYKCSELDILIDIQCRYVDKPLLEDYADYIICSLAAIYNGLDESKEFLTNARFRNRTYQLYTMMEKIFFLEMSKNEERLLKQVYQRINNAIDIFYDDSILYKRADNGDVEILNELIAPRIEKITNHVSQMEDLVTITAKSYHVRDEMSLAMGRTVYLRAKQVIQETYLNYI